MKSQASQSFPLIERGGHGFGGAGASAYGITHHSAASRSLMNLMASMTLTRAVPRTRFRRLRSGQQTPHMPQRTRFIQHLHHGRPISTINVDRSDDGVAATMTPPPEIPRDYTP
jgi:hypothetical protein